MSRLTFGIRGVNELRKCPYWYEKIHVPVFAPEVRASDVLDAAAAARARHPPPEPSAVFRSGAADVGCLHHPSGGSRAERHLQGSAVLLRSAMVCSKKQSSGLFPGFRGWRPWSTHFHSYLHV